MSAVVDFYGTEEAVTMELMHSGNEFVVKELEKMHPAIDIQSINRYKTILVERDIQIADLKHMDHATLKELGIQDPVHRARILSHIKSDAIRSCPPKINGQPVQVQIKAGVSTFGSIDTLNQSSYIKFFLDLVWTDPSMIGAKAVPDHIWRPEAYVFNALDGMIVDKHPPVLMNPDTGEMLYAQAVQCSLDNPMDLLLFPFDSDSNDIFILQDEHQSADEYVFVPAEEEFCSVKLFFNPSYVSEWALRGFSVDTWKAIGGNGVEYAHCKIHLHLKRYNTFYMWKVVLPLFLSTLIALSAFLYEPESLSDRTNISLTMFLATAALLFVIGGMLPKTSFLTLIDYFVVANLLIQFGIMFINYFVAGRFGDFGERPNEIINTISFIILPVGYIGLTMFLFLPAIIHDRLMPPNARPIYPLVAFDDPKRKLAFHSFSKGVNVFV